MHREIKVLKGLGKVHFKQPNRSLMNNKLLKELLIESQEIPPKETNRIKWLRFCQHKQNRNKLDQALIIEEVLTNIDMMEMIYTIEEMTDMMEMAYTNSKWPDMIPNITISYMEEILKMRFQWIIIEVVATRIKYKVRLYHNMKRRLQILINIISPKVRVTIILMILKNPDTKRLKDSRYHLIDGAIIRFSLENKCPKFQGRYRNNLDLHSEIVIRDLKSREDKALILLLKIPWI